MTPLGAVCTVCICNFVRKVAVQNFRTVVNITSLASCHADMQSDFKSIALTLLATRYIRNEKSVISAKK